MNHRNNGFDSDLKAEVVFEYWLFCVAIFGYALVTAALWRDAAWWMYAPHGLLWCGNVVSDPYMLLVNVVGPAAAVCSATLIRRCVQSRCWPWAVISALLAFALTTGWLVHEYRLFQEVDFPLGRIWWLPWM